jgi:glyoxylate reductase/D-3-phosphoglycerate dehydrogenase
MANVVIEQDAFMRMFAPMLDPSMPQETVTAIGDFFAHDVPDFSGWLSGLRQSLPNLFPAQVQMADSQEEFRDMLKSADACIVESLSVGAPELTIARSLRSVQKYGYITRNIDLAACRARSVRVTTQRRRVNVAVAEQAFSLMLTLCKRMTELDHVVDKASLEQRGFAIKPYDRRYAGSSNFARIPGLRVLDGATLGIIGLGEIGRELATRADAFGMQILYTQRTRLTAAEEHQLNATYVSKSELLQRADYLSTNLPVTDATRGILRSAEFDMLKPGATLINVARAELINREALLEALKSQKLAAFGTDVWYEEPVRASDPILHLPNVLIMPHTAIANRWLALRDIEDMFHKIDRALNT